MTVETHVFAAGQWRKAKDIHVNRNGTWTPCKEVWVNVNGTWRLVYQSGFTFTDTAVGYNYNVRAAALAAGWDGLVPLTANITIEATAQKPGPGGAGSTGNLVYDGGFTRGGERWSLGGWTYVNGGGGHAIFTVQDGSAIATSDRFLVNAGSSYTLQFSATTSNLLSGSVSGDIEWFDTLGNSMGASSPSLVLDTGGLEQFASVTGEAPVGAARARARIYTNAVAFVPDIGSASVREVKVAQGVLPTAFSDEATLGSSYNSSYGSSLLGSTSTSTPAFDTGTLSPGSVVTLHVPAGAMILGCGGDGGFGGIQFPNSNPSTQVPSTPGSPGGPAVRAQAPLIIVNEGIISGGGGGGAGGPGSNHASQGFDDPGTGGGGGAGYNAGAGGSSYRTVYAGAPGTQTAGGNPGTLTNQGSKEWATAGVGGKGGNLGEPGAQSSAVNDQTYQGGAAGPAVSGSSHVTWQVYGDVRGPVS